MLTIAVMGTFDTKGAEHVFVAEQIKKAGLRTLLIDVGITDRTSIEADITCRKMCADASLSSNDRGAAIADMAEHVPLLVRDLYAARKMDGIISLGGTGGTSIATAAMRALPIGFPKVMVSTVAGGDVSRYVEISDVVMVPSIVDVSGLNRISQTVFSRAAAAVVAMAQANATFHEELDSRPVIVASMFGNTTRCVEHARGILEAAGYEVIVFHATGVGGRSMEALIESGMVSGVLDITTTEWADELVGGIMPGGPNRLRAAAVHGIPAVVAPGCLDMVNFGQHSSVPDRFLARKLYQHNPQITLMRTTAEECTELGGRIAAQLNLSVGPVHVLFPLRAISVISAKGQPFHDPAADEALLASLSQSLRDDIALEVIDCEINDELFAERSARLLMQLINQSDNVAQL